MAVLPASAVALLATTGALAQSPGLRQLEKAAPSGTSAPPAPAGGPVLDDDILRREYEDYRASVKGLRLYHVRYIRVATEPEAQELITRIRSGAGFEELARKHSTHSESAARGGDLGSHASCRWSRSTLEMLDSLKRGQTWPRPVKGTHGWGVYRLESVAEIEPRPFSRYRSELLAGRFEPECPWVPPVTIAPAPAGGAPATGRPPAAAPGLLRK